MTSKYRYLIPNMVTFLSLTCGIAAILASATGSLTLGGSLILASYVLDLLDGALARKLKAGSEFGLQLDSLTDMVSLGTAPAILAFFYLKTQGVPLTWVWPFVLFFPLAGAFRLARFNLLPPKTGKSDSVGLTISTAGATLTLAVLSNLAVGGSFIPDFAFIPLMVVLSILMVSMINFPSTHLMFSRRRINYLYLVLFGAFVVVLQWPLFNTWFLFTSGYLGFGLARAGYKAIDT